MAPLKKRGNVWHLRLLLAFPQNFNNGFRLSRQEAAFPFHTSSLVNRKVILRLSRFDLLCGPNASGISVRTFYDICLSEGERTELERCALECQNVLRVDFTYIYCFECENIGTFKKGITLFFVFITILVANHSRDGIIGLWPCATSRKITVSIPDGVTGIFL
jgi:hypothetical protein